MKTQLFKYWDLLRASFWFVPGLMACAALAFSQGSVLLDEVINVRNLRTWGWSFTGGPESASAVLVTIATSMVTIAGVVFSMTLVALSLASSQLGPRLLRNFMRDTANQVVLGTFVSTFLYCLLVLRTIRHADDIEFVPDVSVTFAVMFAVISLGVFIYFIHHVSVSIQADQVVARIGLDLMHAIDQLYPENLGREPDEIAAQPIDAGLADALTQLARPVVATDDGYLQFIDEEALMELAVEADVVLQVERRPGQYVVANHPLVSVWPKSRVDDEFAARINLAFAVGSQRTSGQDIELAVNQLVEIAVRALSPGVNDPFTAIRCVDRMGSALSRLAQRSMPSPHRYDDQGRLRVITPVVHFPGIADAAFNQIRQYARTSAAVTIRLLESITVVGAAVQRPQDRDALLRHAQMIARGAREGLSESEDQREVEERFQAAAAILDISARTRL